MSLGIILETMIGMTFIYLLLSLVLTALTEFLSSLLRRRPGLLRQGIRQLLQDDTWTEDFFAHPLIKALRQPGPFWWNRSKLRHPSYIPKVAFSQTVIDLLARGKDGGGQEKDRDIQSLEDNLARLPVDLRKALTALFETSGKDPVRFQMALEGWFDDAMERVSGWYKRRTNSIILALAVPLVIYANVDTVVLVKALWISPTVREALVARAGTYANDQGDTLPKEEQLQTDQAARAALSSSYRNLDEVADSLDLPVGWRQLEERPARAAKLEEFALDPALFGRHALGWAMTVFALSMGAPFWFDTLNRLIKLRVAGRNPEEKEAEDRKQKRT